MTDNEIISALRLQRIPHIGDISAKKLIQYCGSPSAVFTDKKKHLLSIDGIGTSTIRELGNPVYLREAHREWKYINENGINILYFEHEDYPAQLKHCVDAPIALFSKGALKLEKNSRLISVVGTRQATRYGKEVCRNFIAEIAPLNPIIISGFAYGIDICAQRAALDFGLQTIGCLAHGLDQVYPKVHSRYVPEILSNGGFVTECWSNTIPERQQFLRRNRIIAGMSQATVIIESAERGGSLVTADIANSYNRDVFAVPGKVNDLLSTGCNNLIKQQKAHLLSCAGDLIYLMNWEIDEKLSTKPVQTKMFTELDKVQQTIYDYLNANGRQMLDDIALGCQLSISEASSALFTMEMLGCIRPLPGKFFENL